jgi:ribonucleoside-diphosphate reductase subunit M1
MCDLYVDRVQLGIVNPKNGRPAGMISQETYKVIMANKEVLDSAIIYNRDFSYN